MKLEAAVLSFGVLLTACGLAEEPVRASTARQTLEGDPGDYEYEPPPDEQQYANWQWPADPPSPVVVTEPPEAAEPAPAPDACTLMQITPAQCQQWHLYRNLQELQTMTNLINAIHQANRTVSCYFSGC